jgi:putative phage-type endonuclease
MIEQGTPEWKQIRCGKVTASKVADVIAKTKSGPAASRETYMTQLVLEQLTGKVAESYKNQAMQWGNDTEPLARAAYEKVNNVLVEQVSFVEHPLIHGTGASPDGYVGLFGLVEFKCPESHTHVETLISKKIPQKYFTQMQWQMRVCDRQWCDFVSYDPRLVGNLQLFIQRVEFDPEYVAMLEKEVTSFINELDAKVNLLKGMLNV